MVKQKLLLRNYRGKSSSLTFIKLVTMLITLIHCIHYSLNTHNKTDLFVWLVIFVLKGFRLLFLAEGRGTCSSPPTSKSNYVEIMVCSPRM